MKYCVLITLHIICIDLSAPLSVHLINDIVVVKIINKQYQSLCTFQNRCY
jgi:hypothetical protein